MERYTKHRRTRVVPRKNKLPRTNPIRAMFSYLKWLDTCLTKVGFRAHSLILKVVEKIAIVYESRGIREAINYSKSLRLSLLNYIFSSQGLQDGVQPSIPKLLRPWKPYLTGPEWQSFTRLALSALYLTRALRLEPKPSFATIQAPPDFNPDDVEFERKEMARFWKELGVNRKQLGKVPKRLRFKEFHMSSKNGPNGHALWNSYVDARALPKELKLDLLILGGMELYRAIEQNLALSSRIPEFFDSLNPWQKGVEIRRLSCISDKEGKTREIAIFDYWSQAALKPLHEYLYRILSTINQDCTFDQSSTLGDFSREEVELFESVDITAFTDRCPILLQRLLLEVRFGKEYAYSWWNVMVGYPFEYKGDYMYYRTGNPMGAYSSWSTATLLHHYFVWKSCRRSRQSWRKYPYKLLGDDIVLTGRKVPKVYRSILQKWHMDVSEAKTHTSEHGFEFAKQIYLHGTNVSPFPLSALYDRRNSTIESVGIILSELHKKAWTSDIQPVLKGYFLIIAGWKRPKFRAFYPKLLLVTGLWHYLQGLKNLGNPVMEYVNFWTKREWKVHPVHLRAYAHWLSVKTIQTLFMESRDRVTSNDNHIPLGVLATRMVMAITSLKDGGEDCFDLISAVPFLMVYGRAEETFLKLNRDLNDKGLGTHGKDLRSFIGKVDIPMSDRDFYVRNRSVLIIKALKSSRIIEGLIKSTAQVVSWNGRLDFTLPWYEFTSVPLGDLLEDRRMPPRVKPGGP